MQDTACRTAMPGSAMTVITITTKNTTAKKAFCKSFSTDFHFQRRRNGRIEFRRPQWRAAAAIERRTLPYLDRHQRVSVLADDEPRAMARELFEGESGVRRVMRYEAPGMD